MYIVHQTISLMKKIEVSINVKADIEKVWAFWTKPSHIVHWNFASPSWHCPKATNSLIVGEKFNWRMEAKDGTMGFDFEGIYTEISPLKLIKFQLLDNRQVNVEFFEKDNQVLIVETFDAEGTNTDEQQRAGWQAILENFKTYVETN